MVRSPLASLAVLALLSWVTSVGAKEDQQNTARDENLPHMGEWNGPPISHDRNKRASAAADSDISTMFKKFMQTSEFSSAVNLVAKNERDKKYECIKRHGKSAYYNPDLHTCGDCWDENCLSNDVCTQECAQVRENLFLRDELRSVKRQVEGLHIGLWCCVGFVLLIVVVVAFHAYKTRGPAKTVPVQPRGDLTETKPLMESSSTLASLTTTSEAAAQESTGQRQDNSPRQDNHQDHLALRITADPE